MVVLVVVVVVVVVVMIVDSSLNVSCVGVSLTVSSVQQKKKEVIFHVRGC